MTRLLELVEEILLEDGYRCTEAGKAGDELRFEDSSLFGSVVEFDSVESLLANWQDRESAFLREYSSRLQMHPEKAWNVYAVFLTHSTATGANIAELSSIEENFRATRKIARADVETRQGARRALSSLLALRAPAVLQSVELASRLDGVVPEPILRSVLADESVTSIVSHILGDHEAHSH